MTHGDVTTTGDRLFRAFAAVMFITAGLILAASLIQGARAAATSAQLHSGLLGNKTGTTAAIIPAL